jgi:hypothetical protein
VFVTAREQYARNIRESSNYMARPARLTTPTDEREPAVILYCGGHIKAVMPVADALRLANQIADAVEAHDNRG